MALLAGKKAFIFGVLNEYSIGYHIAQELHAQGCELAFSHLPAEKIERRVVKAVEKFKPKFLAPCDVSKDEDTCETAFKKAGEKMGTFDILVHSLAFAPAEALHNPFLQTTREQWRMALDISAYSLVAMAKRLPQPLMNTEWVDHHDELPGGGEVYSDVQRDGGGQGGAGVYGALPGRGNGPA